MKPLGIDLAGIASDAPPSLDGTPACPGASLRLDRAMLAELRRGGEHFKPGGEEIPYSGLGTIRVACVNPVAELPQTAAGYKQFYGLCHSCSGLEASNRQWLRVRAGSK